MTAINGWFWQDYDELTSTNDTAAALCENPPAEKFVITARRQTRGRGRRGRAWSSLEGNLFMSLALPVEPQKLTELVFVISLSLLQTIRKMAPELEVRLKWPNDVLVQGGKISGILLEKSAGMYIIAGIGVNLAAAPTVTEGGYPAVSLAGCGITTDRTAFLQSFLERLDENLSHAAEDFAAIRTAWLQNAKGLNEPIRVNTPKESISGIFRGLSGSGLLLLEQDEKIIKIAAGDVFFDQSAGRQSERQK